jgi:hypothetical protein
VVAVIPGIPTLMNTTTLPRLDKHTVSDKNPRVMFADEAPDVTICPAVYLGSNVLLIAIRLSYSVPSLQHRLKFELKK